MEHDDKDIESLKEAIAKCEDNVEAQRERLAGLQAHENAAWVAAELLAGSEAMLQGLRDHLDTLESNKIRGRSAETVDDGYG